MTNVWRRCVGAGRAALVLFVAFGTLTLLYAGQLRAAWGERLLGFGAELRRWEGVRLSSDTRVLALNGAELSLVSATSALTVTEVLDRLEQACATSGGVVGAERAEQLLLKPTNGVPILRPWIRRERDGQGVLACLDTGGAVLPTDLAARLSAFAHSGDLSQAGRLRYAHAERQGERTSVLFVWADGALPLRAMFPKAGDAPGVDPVGVPRPPGAERVLSGVELGAPYGVSAYRSPAAESPKALLAWYREALPRAGFQVTDAGPESLLVRQNERALLVHAVRSRSGVVAAVGTLR